MNQLNARRLNRRTDQCIAGWWTIGIQVANVATIYKAIQARKDRSCLLISHRQSTILSIGLNVIPFIFNTLGLTGEHARGSGSNFFFQATWIHPEGFQTIGRQIGSDELNGFACLIDSYDLYHRDIVTLQGLEHLLFCRQLFVDVDMDMFAWCNHHLNVQDARLWTILDMDTYNAIGVFRLTQRRSDHALGHTDQFTGRTNPHQGYSSCHYFAGERHGAKLLPPALNNSIGHMLASLVDEYSVA